MLSSRSARRRGAATLALAVAGLTASTLTPVAPAGATEATQTVSFLDCEVRAFPYDTNRRIKDNVAWTTPVRLNVPSPIAARDEVTAEAQLSQALPADLLPTVIKNVEIDVQMVFSTPLGGDLFIDDINQRPGDYDPSVPLSIDEVENDEYWPESGIYDYRVKSVYLLFTGTDPNDEFAEYSFECDQITDPTTLLSVAVYDLSATPEVRASEYYLKQGSAFTLTGTNLLAAAPTTPPAQVSVSIGGVDAGSFPLDQAGGFTADLKVPPFTPPGTAVTIRVANGPKVATTQIGVVALKAKVGVAPKAAKSGKKVTVTGSKFKPGEKVTLTLKGGRGKGKKAFTVSAKASSAGTIRKAVKLKKAAKGAWKVTAKGAASKRSAATGFKVR